MKYAPWALIALIALALGPWPARSTHAQLSATNTVFLPLVITPPASNQTPEQLELTQAVLALVNSARASAGCAPLTTNNLLTEAAQNQSQDMALNDFFSHTNPDPSRATVGQRVSAVGYSWSGAAENIAAGYSTPSAVMSGWMSSDGHRKNILNCAYTEIGIGYYYQADDQPLSGYSWPFYHYWTQVFARP